MYTNRKLSKPRTAGVAMLTLWRNKCFEIKAIFIYNKENTCTHVTHDPQGCHGRKDFQNPPRLHQTSPLVVPSCPKMSRIPGLPWGSQMAASDPLNSWRTPCGAPLGVQAIPCVPFPKASQGFPWPGPREPMGSVGSPSSDQGSLGLLFGFKKRHFCNVLVKTVFCVVFYWFLGKSLFFPHPFFKLAFPDHTLREAKSIPYANLDAGEKFFKIETKHNWF